LITICCKS